MTQRINTDKWNKMTQQSTKIIERGQNTFFSGTEKRNHLDLLGSRWNRPFLCLLKS